ncbi:hypothetical protein OP10G_3793 [Fimbriimonas ginsengisoli Gsoil 348]|uniref:Transcription factor zinc-finger domain-containing protein n=1 Tax=Fimbriimonas ginsengisoli Gsoil 348 TaxID=661478 RepID=A0A068NUP2_FIMGI|nr:hypothetical protein OP10G_3793 [Fimbriimonas ginsengisoli Gsoil 348]
MPLEAREFQGVTIDACSKCAGIFFDEGEVGRIKAQGLAAFDALEDAVVPTIDVEAIADRPRACPSCGTTMDKFRYMYSSKLMLDECERCGGIWVQDGELRHMRQVLQEQGLQRPAVSIAQGKKADRPASGYADRMRKVHQFILSVGGRAA